MCRQLLLAVALFSSIWPVLPAFGRALELNDAAQ